MPRRIVQVMSSVRSGAKEDHPIGRNMFSGGMDLDEPLSIFDSTLSRAQNGYHKASGSQKRSGTVKRGRPKKRKNDSDFSETSESDMEEDLPAPVEAVSSEGDPDDKDPEWNVVIEKNRQAKGIFGQRTRGRPRGSYKNIGQPRLGQVVVDDLERREIEYFISKAPHPEATPPSLETREWGKTIDALEQVKNSSGGFRSFIKAFNDTATVEIFSYVEKRYSFPENSDDALQIVQAFRHMWNKIPVTTRAVWEEFARNKAKEDNENGEEDPSFVPLTLEDIMTHATQKKTAEPHATMPLNEIPYREDTKYEPNVVIPSCCPDAAALKNFGDVKKHFLGKHYTAYLYACHFCNLLHETKEDFLKHTCQEFTDYQITRLVAGNVNAPEMNSAYLFLTCYECGLWMPIRDSYKGERLEQAWSFYVTINRHHCGRSLNLVVVFTMEAVLDDGGKYLHTIIVPNTVTKLPVSCTECDVTFESLSQCNEHMMKHEALSCNKCNEEFGTEAHLKNHLSTHLQNKLIFARYLSETMTVYPPVHVKNGLPRVGFRKGNRIAYGDKISTNEESLFEFTESEEFHGEEKINNSVNSPAYFAINDKFEPEGLSEQYTRHDAGLEDSKQFEIPEGEEAEAVAKLNKVFASQMTKKLPWNTHIHNMAGLKKGFSYEERVDEEDEKRELKERLRNTIKSNLLDDVTTTFGVKINLPMMACFDGISDGLLVKDFYICDSCSTIYESDGTFAHDCSSEHVHSIHKWADGRNNRVQCHLCSARLCSISALRGHYACDHLKNVDLHPMVKKTNLFTIANEALTKKEYSEVAWRVDNSIHMGESNGVLTEKRRQQVKPINYRPMEATPRPRFDPRTFPVPRGGAAYTPAAKSSMLLVKPFLQNPNNLTLVCHYCKVMCTDMKKMREHLRLMHTIMCRGCGQAFAIQKNLTNHEKFCPKPFQSISMGSIEGQCTFCRRVDNLPNLYTHIFVSHFNLIAYGSEDGRIYQRGSNGLFIKNIHAGSVTFPSLTSGVSTPALPANTCYLCGYAAASKEVLKSHLEKHPEKWDICPFCPNQFIRSYQDFENHLRLRHYEQATMQMVCKMCHQLVDKNNLSHVLYQCTQAKKCAFCPVTLPTEQLRVHWKMNHEKIFNRFRCSECKITSPQMTVINSHNCKVFEMDHQCDCGVILSNRSKFVDHYWIHIDSANQKCRLCDIRFIGGQNIGAHRVVHTRVVGSATKRQVIFLDDNLFGGIDEKKPTAPAASPSKSQPAENRDGSDIEIIDEDSAPDSPSATVPSDEKTVKSVLRKLVRDVCREQGEELTEEEEIDDVLTANVRTEDDDIHVVNQSHPGYTENDDDDMDTQVPSSLAGVFRMINEITEDEDISVVGEVDHPAGSSQTAIALSVSREKKHKCAMCSQSFVTHASLLDHEIKSHKNDVGGVCDKVYGAPVVGQFYVCRNCCALFETYNSFNKHMQAHGANSGISCAQCSNIAYNQPLYQQHTTCHAKTHRNRLQFGCGACRKYFRTDARLYEHLHSTHQIPLMFFCKNCSLTSYDPRSMFDHLQNVYRCRSNLITKGMRQEQMIGVFPANLVHYQPDNPDVFDQRVRIGQIKLLTPSDCAHRSFLTLTDSVITCKDCYCTMSQATFHANETFANGGIPVNQAFGSDYQEDFPFLKDYGFRMRQQYNQNLVRAMPITRGRPSSRGMRPPMFRNPVLAQVQKTPMLTGSPLSSFQRTYNISKPIASVTPQRLADDDIIMVDAAKPIRGNVTNPTRAVPLKSAGSGKCDVCNAALTNVKVTRLHELHKSGKEWFCLNCATAHKSEVDAVTHAYNCNLSEEKQAALRAASGIRPMIFSLQCPIDSCTFSKKMGKNAMRTLSEFKSHFNKCHQVELPHISGCGQRFATQEALAKHEAEHTKFEDMGVVAMCCPLCGVGNQWNLTTDIHGHQTILSHLVTHGLHHYSMCRGCFTCFPNDFDNAKMLRHFEQQHFSPIGSQVKCKYCFVTMNQDQVKSHILEKHVVRGYKARHNPNRQVVVKTGGVTRLFMGLPFDGFVDDDEKSL